MERQLQTDIAELKKASTENAKAQISTSREVALVNQFNQEVIKPFIVEMKDAIKTYPTRVEFDELKVEVDGKVSRKEVIAIAAVAGFIATVLGIVVSMLTIYSKFTGSILMFHIFS